VKVGDLGISVKLDPTDASGDAPKYFGKGLTTGMFLRNTNRATLMIRSYQETNSLDATTLLYKSPLKKSQNSTSSLK